MGTQLIFKLWMIKAVTQNVSQSDSVGVQFMTSVVHYILSPIRLKQNILKMDIIKSTYSELSF